MNSSEQQTKSSPMTGGLGAAESFAKRWSRRAITVTLYTASCLALLASLPALIVIAAVVDIARRSNWAAVRFITLLAFYLCCEVSGIAMSFLIWLASVITRAGRERFLDWNFALQQWWAGCLFRAGTLLFKIKVDIEGADDIGEGPFIVFIRHVSLGDTLLPSTILSKREGLRLRFVLKSQLLWDPCLEHRRQQASQLLRAPGSRGRDGNLCGAAADGWSRREGRGADLSGRDTLHA